MLIVEAKDFDPTWLKWHRTKCACGNKYCRFWYLSLAGTGGRLSVDDARLAVAAPKLLKILVSITGNEETWKNLNVYQQARAREALKAALGSSKVGETP